MDHTREFQIFCENIRYLRRSNKLSQKEMAKLLHISVDYVRRLEKGEIPTRLTVNILYYIYTVFGVSPATITEALLDTNKIPQAIGCRGRS